jgi:hypothetical protein
MRESNNCGSKLAENAPLKNMDDPEPVMRVQSDSAIMEALGFTPPGSSCSGNVLCQLVRMGHKNTWYRQNEYQTTGAAEAGIKPEEFLCT